MYVYGGGILRCELVVTPGYVSGFLVMTIWSVIDM